MKVWAMGQLGSSEGADVTAPACPTPTDTHDLTDHVQSVAFVHAPPPSPDDANVPSSSSPSCPLPLRARGHAGLEGEVEGMSQIFHD